MQQTQYDQWGNPLQAPGSWTQNGQPYVPPGSPNFTQNGQPYVAPAPVLSMPAPGVGPEGPAPAGNLQNDTTTNTTPNGAGLGSGLGTGLLAPFTGTFNAPTPQPLPSVPQFNGPQVIKPPAFSYDPWQAPDPFQLPTEEQAAAEPGYKLSVDQANQAFMNTRAAQGTAHTGGTLKDFLNYNQNLGAQNYSNVANRAFGVYNQNFNNSLQTYSANRANALGNYNTNYQTQYQDPWNEADALAQQSLAPQMQGYATQSANVQHQNDVANSNAWNQYLQSFNIFGDQRDSTYNKLLQYGQS
jgi:hypothetical protein